MKLNVWAFALTCAIMWGVGLCLITWWIMLFDGATGREYVIGQVYRGWNVSPLGSVFGLLWGFADGLVGGMVFAWLYNLLSRPRNAPREPAE